MKIKIVAVLLLLVCPVFAEDEILSQSSDRNAKVIGIIGSHGAANSIRLVVNGKVVWDCALAWGYPVSTNVSWSPHSTKVAISIRTTKTSSEVHVFDCNQELKELPIPDMGDVTLAINSHIAGRFLHISPIGWTDEDTVLLVSAGNLIDSTTDGSETLNFKYQATIHIPTKRVLAISCLSSHNLNDESIKRRNPSPPSK